MTIVRSRTVTIMTTGREKHRGVQQMLMRQYPGTADTTNVPRQSSIPHHVDISSTVFLDTLPPAHDAINVISTMSWSSYDFYAVIGLGSTVNVPRKHDRL